MDHGFQFANRNKLPEGNSQRDLVPTIPSIQPPSFLPKIIHPKWHKDLRYSAKNIPSSKPIVCYGKMLI